jgi:hypothetical protein
MDYVDVAYSVLQKTLLFIRWWKEMSWVIEMVAKGTSYLYSTDNSYIATMLLDSL